MGLTPVNCDRGLPSPWQKQNFEPLPRVVERERVLELRREVALLVVGGDDDGDLRLERRAPHRAP